MQHQHAKHPIMFDSSHSLSLYHNHSPHILIRLIVSQTHSIIPWVHIKITTSKTRKTTRNSRLFGGKQSTVSLISRLILLDQSTDFAPTQTSRSVDFGEVDCWLPKSTDGPLVDLLWMSVDCLPLSSVVLCQSTGPNRLLGGISTWQSTDLGISRLSPYISRKKHRFNPFPFFPNTYTNILIMQPLFL